MSRNLYRNSRLDSYLEAGTDGEVTEGCCLLAHSPGDSVCFFIYDLPRENTASGWLGPKHQSVTKRMNYCQCHVATSCFSLTGLALAPASGMRAEEASSMGMQQTSQTFAQSLWRIGWGWLLSVSWLAGRSEKVSPLCGDRGEGLACCRMKWSEYFQWLG